MVMKSVLLPTICLILLCLSQTAEASPPDEYMAKPNCRNRCGNVSIPFPFGMGRSCYMNEWYSVNCSKNTSSGAEKPFLNHTKLNLELLNVSIRLQTVTINSPIAIASYDQRRGVSNINSVQKSIDLKGSPFLFSRLDNILVVLGCGHAELREGENIRAGCSSTNCGHSYYNSTVQGCYGISCCQTTIPSTDDYYLTSYSVDLSSSSTPDDEENSAGGSNSTTYAFLVDRNWFSRKFTRPDDVRGVKYYAPLSLFWIIKEGDDTTSNCNHTSYYSSLSGSYLHSSCGCEDPILEGNPYLSDGCHGTDFFLDQVGIRVTGIHYFKLIQIKNSKYSIISIY